MGLFWKRGKTKGEESGCACNGACGGANRAIEVVGLAAGVGGDKAEEAVSSVAVLGTGCKSCHALLANAQEAVHALGLPVEVEYVTDLQRIVGYGVLRTPALVVNERVVSSGRLLKAGEVEELLKKYRV